MKPRLAIERPDGTFVSPSGHIQLSADGLHEKLEIVGPVMRAMRDGVELFPGQRAIEPLLARCFDQPLYVVLVGKFQGAIASSAAEQELWEVELAKPSEGLLTAVAAVLACDGYRQVVE